MRGVAAEHLAVLKAMGIAPCGVPSERADLILDGVIGYSLIGAPTGRAAELVDRANGQVVPVLTQEAPSGPMPLVAKRTIR